MSSKVKLHQPCVFQAYVDRMKVIITNCIFPGDKTDSRKSPYHYEDERGMYHNAGAASPGLHRGRQAAGKDSLTPGLISAEPSDVKFQLHSKWEQFRTGFGILNACNAHQCSFAFPGGGHVHQCNSLIRVGLVSGRCLWSQWLVFSFN